MVPECLIHMMNEPIRLLGEINRKQGRIENEDVPKVRVETRGIDGCKGETRL
jgi:hypothetical protein